MFGVLTFGAYTWPVRVLAALHTLQWYVAFVCRARASVCNGVATHTFLACALVLLAHLPSYHTHDIVRGDVISLLGVAIVAPIVWHTRVAMVTSTPPPPPPLA